MKNIKKSALILILTVAFILPLLAGCANTKNKEDNTENFAGKKMGVVTGTIFEKFAKEHYPEAEICYYNNDSDIAEALEKGKIDAYMLDEPVGRLLIREYPEQGIYTMVEESSYAFAFAKDSERADMLRKQMDKFIEKSKQNGVMQELDDIWFGIDESKKVVDFSKLTGENGTIRLATSTDVGAPFTYIKDGKFVGYELDIIVRFCEEYGYDLEISNYNFSALITAVASGKDDIAACALAISEERKESVNFSTPSYSGGVVVITKGVTNKQTKQDFAEKNVGVVAGSMFESATKELFPKANIMPYSSNNDMIAALDNGTIDAYMIDEPIGRLIVQTAADQYLSDVLEEESYAFAFQKNSEKSTRLRQELDSFIIELQRNGTLKEIDNIWFGTDESLKTIPYDKLTGKNGTIRYATSTSVGEPFAYLKDGVLVGYEVDILTRFCIEKGYDLEVTDYNFSSLLPAIIKGKEDIAGCAIAITDERKEEVDFSLADYEGGIVAVTKTPPKFNFDSFSGKKIGIPTGSVFDEVLLKKVPDVQLVYINAYADLSVALDSGKIDAYVADQPVARLMGGKYPNQEIAIELEDASYGFMFPKDDAHEKVYNEFNEFIAKCWEDGTIEQVDEIWFGNDSARQKVDISNLTAKNGVLEMAVTSDVGAPFAYVQDGQMVGYDVDLAARFCREYGYGLNVSDYNLTGLLAATSTGKADMAASSLNITPERLETALMSSPNYIGGVVVVTNEKQINTKQTTIFESLKESFERTFVRENRWKLFVSGIGTTFLIAIASMILGSLGGFGVYLIIRKKNKVFNGFWAVFESIMGRTPVVVILMILYYLIFKQSNLSGTIVSIIGFTLLFICTVANLLKMGAGAVDFGQEEAALSMGYSERETYFHIVFPQSIKHFLPAYKTEVISLVKATAIVGYIAVQDLTKVGDLIRSRTYEAFFPLIATAIIYYGLTWLFTWLIRRINVKIEPRSRSAKKILKGIKQ